jgi:hypothetical protein
VAARNAASRVRQMGWALVPIVSFTVLAWSPFLRLALIRERRRDWAVFAAYLIAVVAEVVLVALGAAGILPSTGHAGNVMATLFFALLLLVAVTAAVHTLVAFRPRAKLPSMSAARARAEAELDASGTVTIGKGQGAFLRADDQGLLMRNVPWRRVRRIAWTEISRFTDGRQVQQGGTATVCWVLVIVPHNGKRAVPLATHPLMGRQPEEIVKVIHELAERHGIPADLTGLPPESKGFWWNLLGI